MDLSMSNQLNKEFLSSFFANEGASEQQAEQQQEMLQQQRGASASNTNPAAASSSESGQAQQLNLDFLGLGLNLMPGMQGMQGDGQQSAQSAGGGQQAMLEQQLKLARLKQLQVQHEILQQQIELISSGQNAMSLNPPMGGMEHNSSQGQSYSHGLPTPASSTELRAQPNTDFVSPMTLHYMDISQDTPPIMHSNHPSHSHQQHQHHQQHQQHQHQQQQHGRSVQSSPHMPPHMWNSAPATMVFNTTPPNALNSSNDIDIDISPLTSPWFGPMQTPQMEQAHAGSSQMQGQLGAPSSGSSGAGMHTSGAHKRTASPAGEEPMARLTRKRPSPGVRPSASTSGQGQAAPSGPPPPGGSRRGNRPTKSASSTPLLRGTPRTRRGSLTATANFAGPLAGDVPGDTPSPVDLSMPPPAPPLAQADSGGADMMGSASSSAGASGSSPMQISLTPVTPGSIMNIGRLGLRSGLTPPSHSQDAGPSAYEVAGRAMRPRASTSSSMQGAGPSGSGGSGRSRKSNSVGTATSPAFKPILPAGNSVAPLQAPQAHTGTQKKMTNHKESEQKRRDSLKAAYDTLRGLLPPIPLPNEDGAANEPILPGALPPRGPPRGAGEGPNRGVSKLQLLRCGNEFIKALTGRVERRDEEIDTLRREIVRLRGLMGDVAEEGEFEKVDLARDVDAVEGGGGTAYLARAAADDGDDMEDE